MGSQLPDLDLDEIIRRAQLRLEQYVLHAASLESNGKDAQGARDLVERLEIGLARLEEFRELTSRRIA
jgi:hypothetical protein